MTPPITIGPKMLSLCTEIGILLGQLAGMGGPTPQPMLRRSNRVRTIYGTLAIEGNTLSLDQVTAVIEGKRVLGPAKDIQEVKNALQVYERLDRWVGTSSKSLLKAHGMLMHGLSDEAGCWRCGNVGIVKGKSFAHVAPPHQRVPFLMEELFNFVRGEPDLHWLIKATVFHYELEFIHPFADGNGRMGRLWQQVLMLAHNPAFAYLPIESLVRDKQDDYYKVLGQCDREGESTNFVEFMLEQVRQCLSELWDAIRPDVSTKESRVERALLKFGDRKFTRKDYMRLHRNISSATASRDLRWAVEQALVEREGTMAKAQYQRIVL